MSDPVEAARSEASRQRLAGRGYEGEADLRRALREDGHLGVRAEAAHLLGFDGAADAAGDLERALREDDSARVRVEAALALGRLGRRDEALEVLSRELGGAFFADAPLRAARALALLGDASGWSRVVSALGSDQPAERMEAVGALPAFAPLADGGEIDPAAALRTAVDDAEPIVAGDARAALERLGTAQP
jgi:HEAT repeat protein